MINEELKNITLRLAESLNPEKIYLFGSFARNEETDESDYDICILMSDNTKNISQIYGNAYSAIREVRTRPIDFIIGTKSGFERRKNLPVLERTIAKEGIILYERID